MASHLGLAPSLALIAAALLVLVVGVVGAQIWQLRGDFRNLNDRVERLELSR